MDPSWDKPTHPTRGQLQVSSLGTSKDGHEAGRESIGTLGAVAAMQSINLKPPAYAYGFYMFTQPITMVNLGMVYYCFTSITTNGCLCLGLKQVPSDTKRAVPGIPCCLGFRISRKGASLVVLMTTAGFRSTRNSERVLFRLWR